MATTSYGAAFASVIERDTVFGVQFHPEKSAGAGLCILANFVTLAAHPEPLQGRRAAAGERRQAERTS